MGGWAISCYCNQFAFLLDLVLLQNTTIYYRGVKGIPKILLQALRLHLATTLQGCVITGSPDISHHPIPRASGEMLVLPASA